MRKSTVFCFLAAVIFICSAVGAAVAVQRVVSESVHEVNMSGIKAQIIEEYKPKGNVYPNSTIDKVVNVKNTGGSDGIVRVKVEKAWGERRSNDGKLIADDTCSTDNIIIDYNTEYWHYDQADGYFYYKGVLKPGETTVVPLFKNFYIDKDTGNEYMGLEADIQVKMECVQAAADGIGIWDKTMSSLGIVYTPEKTENTMTSVVFTGGDEGFSFMPETTDLFANFKNLLPGETRSQTIEVKNNCTLYAGAEIFLRAEEIEQSFATPETLVFVNKLLREYATVIVSNEAGEIIYNGPVWGEPHSVSKNPASMRYDISLGKLAKGDSEKLNIQLQIDPEMDNMYQGLLGLVKWVWSAQGIKQEVPPSDESIIISGTKTWRHGTNPVNARPKKIIIYVKSGNTVITSQTVTAKDHWTWSFKLPKYDKNGKEIQYTIDEAPVKGYTKKIRGYHITNTHSTYKEVIISGRKTWVHGSNSSRRPSSIIVYIKNGDKIAAKKIVTAADGWKWTVNLPKYDENGKVIHYTVDEGNVPYYTHKVDGKNMINTFKGYNYPGDSPRTGDKSSVWIWAALMLVSMSAFIIFFVMDRKSRKNKQRQERSS